MSGKKGADWFEESDRDKMNMLESCERGNLNEVVKLLNGGVDVDEEDDDGVTALQIAAAKGHRSLVEFLIHKGAKVDRANYAGMTPFLHACREGHQDIVTLLANHGANIHAATGLGMSAMALACAGRHLAVVRTLKSLNVAVDPKQNARLHQISPSPYMVAFFQMDIQICGFLKQQNAHIWHRVRGMDGLDVARLGQLLGLPEMLMRLNYSKSTLKAPEGKNDIRQIVQRGDEQTLAQMRDGDVPASLQDGLTPLMFATVAGQLRIAEMLLKVGRGGAIDAQENVLGMTALMFAIVAGESPMVMLLLRHGANPRILSTTREPFSALELALFAELSRDCLSQLCAHWLKTGKGDSAVGTNQQSVGPEGRAAEPMGTNRRDDQQLAPSVGRGALTPRLKRVIESIGKNLMGLATDDTGPTLGWPDLMGSSETRQSSLESGKSRLECLAESTLLEGPARFVLAEHILRGDARPQPSGPKRSTGDTLVQLARQMAISWISKGHSLGLIPAGNGPRAFGAAQGEERESDGLYSAAQRNAEKELKKRHRYEPARKSSRTPLTPRTARTTAQERVPKSPSIEALRTAPHRNRLSHHRAASGGSQSQAAQPDSPGTPTSPQLKFFLTQPCIPQARLAQPLTKELVRSKLRERNLEKQFQLLFGAEEVDEFTFVSLTEEEVRQLCSRHGRAGQDLGARFVTLLQDIKECTASSELL